MKGVTGKNLQRGDCVEGPSVVLFVIKERYVNSKQALENGKWSDASRG